MDLVTSPSENKSKTGGNFPNYTAYWDDGFMWNIKKVSTQAQRLIFLRKSDFAKRKKKKTCGSFTGSHLKIRAVATGRAKLGRGLQDQKACVHWRGQSSSHERHLYEACGCVFDNLWHMFNISISKITHVHIRCTSYSLPCLHTGRCGFGQVSSQICSHCCTAANLGVREKQKIICFFLCWTLNPKLAILF